MTSDSAVSRTRYVETDPLAPVRAWLWVLVGMVLLMVVVGGVTRLTGSGLSITSWRPVGGILPPLSEADWQAEFDAYRQIPQFRIENRWMGLEEFRYIFWWEWIHRFLGRVIGLVFLVPFLVFLFQRRLSWSLAPALAGLFVLGGFQGFLGWWMVSSGLTGRTAVSQYRLAVHLAAAGVLFVALVWVVRSLRARVPRIEALPAGFVAAVAGLGALVFLQIVIGAFVAGLRAGHAFNTWPLMEGRLVPAGLAVMEPLWRNLFENALAVQFVHRVVAYAIAAYAAVLVWKGRGAVGLSGFHAWLPLIGWLVLAQVLLGIVTLLLVVPIWAGLAHQALAFILLGCIAAYLADIRRAVS